MMTDTNAPNLKSQISNPSPPRNPLAAIPTVEEERARRAPDAFSPLRKRRGRYAPRVCDPDFADLDLAEQYRRAGAERHRVATMRKRVNHLVTQIERQARVAGLELKAIRDGARVLIQSSVAPTED
jgi:hypothetical protein